LITNFTFIESIAFATDGLNAKGKLNKHSSESNHKNKFAEMKANYNYGLAKNQINILNGEFLYKKGYTRSGMFTAVLDAGFRNVDLLQAFQ
jgi:hypothetical protein